jgi:hypothetical protein
MRHADALAEMGQLHADPETRERGRNAKGLVAEMSGLKRDAQGAAAREWQ